jgi:hypothetical protein
MALTASPKPPGSDQGALRLALENFHAAMDTMTSEPQWLVGAALDTAAHAGYRVSNQKRKK